MKLEWDVGKAARNLKKHGVSFEDAELVFYDAGRIETCDRREDHDRTCLFGDSVRGLHRSTRRHHPPYFCEESRCQRKKAIPSSERLT